MIEIAPLIEIAAFHGTSLLLIILLSLKAESKSVLHSSDFQSYSLSHHCTPFAPPRIPPPQILLGTYRVLVLQLQASQISTTIKQLLLLFRPFNSKLASLSKAKKLKNLALPKG